MIPYLGDFPAGATVRFHFDTIGADGNSITRATDGTLRVYKNESTTERASAAGITLVEDFDSVTGVHHGSIDLSDNTTAGFYAAGNEYFIVLVGTVVDGATINKTLAQFSIANRKISNDSFDLSSAFPLKQADASTSALVRLNDLVAQGTIVSDISTGVSDALATYFAGIDLAVDAANTKDEYTVQWYKNGAPVTSGITSPTIQVVKRADGADLVASASLTQIGSTGAYKKDEATNRITAGEAVVAIVSATIDSGTRTWRRVISRDSG